MSQLSMDASMQWAAMIQVSGVLLHEMSECNRVLSCFEREKTLRESLKTSLVHTLLNDTKCLPVIFYFLSSFN